MANTHSHSFKVPAEELMCLVKQYPEKERKLQFEFYTIADEKIAKQLPNRRIDGKKPYSGYFCKRIGQVFGLKVGVAKGS